MAMIVILETMALSLGKDESVHIRLRGSIEWWNTNSWKYGMRTTRYFTAELMTVRDTNTCCGYHYITTDPIPKSKGESFRETNSQFPLKTRWDPSRAK